RQNCSSFSGSASALTASRSTSNSPARAAFTAFASSALIGIALPLLSSSLLLLTHLHGQDNENPSWLVRGRWLRSSPRNEGPGAFAVRPGRQIVWRRGKTIMRKWYLALVVLVLSTAAAPAAGGWADKMFKDGVQHDFGTV